MVVSCLDNRIVTKKKQALPPAIGWVKFVRFSKKTVIPGSRRIFDTTAATRFAARKRV